MPDRPHRKPVGTIVRIDRIDIARIEVQVTGTGLTTGSKRPTVAIAGHIGKTTRRSITIAGGAGVGILFVEQHYRDTL